MKITILADNPKSWIHPYITELMKKFEELNHQVNKIEEHTKLTEGDIAFFLCCSKIVPEEYLRINKHNIVVHASDLPKGKGFAPYTWQILEGKNDIPISLIEAVKEVDAGQIYYKDVISFEGHELVDEIRSKIGDKIIEMCMRFVGDYPNIKGKDQVGEGSIYPRRRPKDSEIDPKKSVVELFNQLRVADNDLYPVFFQHKGHTYVLKIEKKED